MSDKIDIKGLHFPDNVRTRPTMYIGSLEGATQLVKEVASNSLDEALSPFSKCDRVIVKELEKIDYILNKKKYKSKGYLILDNGRGLPLAKVKNEKEELVTMARYSVEALHTSSKFMNSVSSIGQNGVGGACCNALSYRYDIYVKLGETAREDEAPDYVKEQFTKKSKVYHLSYSFGLLQTEEILDEEPDNIKGILEDWATAVIFYPDTSIYDTADSFYENESRYTKYLIDRLGKDFKLILNGEEFDFEYQPYEYVIEDKIRTTMEEAESYLEYIVSVGIDRENLDEDIRGCVNGLQVDSKYHTNIVKDAFKEAFYKQFGDCQGKERLGLKFDVIVLCPEPQFDSQTKTRLVDLPYVDWDTFYNSLYKNFTNMLKMHSEEFLEHYNRIIQYLDSLNNLSAIQKIDAHAPQSDSGKYYKARLSQTKVKDCTSMNPEERELFIVEGNSASSTVVQARNRETQAVLPLRGKVLNAAYMEAEDMIENLEISDLVTILGSGIDDNVNEENLRYHKVIITADSDEDGFNIASILLGIIAEHMSYLIKGGYVYLAITPLYEQDGKPIFLHEKEKLNRKKPFQRFKGLGEANVSQMKKYLTNPEHRTLVQVTPENIEKIAYYTATTDGRRELMYECGAVQPEEKWTWDEVGNSAINIVDDD